MAILTRRTLTVTRAPSFRCLRGWFRQSLARVGSLQGHAAQGGHEHVSERCDAALLVGAQARRRGPVGEEVELAFLDAVLHLAARAVDFLVKLLCFEGWRGSEVTMKGGLGPFKSASPSRRPSSGQLCRLVAQLLEGEFGFAAFLLWPQPRPVRLRWELRALRCGKAGDVVDAVSLAPGHQLFAAETGIPPKPDVNIRPAFPDLGNNPGDFLFRASRGVDVRGPEFRQKQFPAAENVKRQIAVTFVIAVKNRPS